MRVLHILGELRPSGAEVMYRAAAGLWRREGLDCEILAIGDEVGPYAAQLEEAGYRVHHLRFSPTLRHVREVYQFLRQHRHDVVHINPERANFWYALAAYLSGTRRIFRTVHSLFPFTRFLFFERLIQRQLLDKVFGVSTIAVGPSVHDLELERFKNKTHIIPNWFDSDRIHPPSPEERHHSRVCFGIPDEVISITSVGSCGPYKNHVAILRAVGLLPSDLPVIYLHAGLENRDSAERHLATQLGITHKVRFLGPVADITSLLHASNVFVMPSLLEGFSCAAIEALGAGLPAILSRVKGLGDLEDTCPGICWVKPTPESLADGLLRLLSLAPEERRQIGLSLSTLARRQYGLESGALAYAHLYQAGPAAADQSDSRRTPAGERPSC